MSGKILITGGQGMVGSAFWPLNLRNPDKMLISFGYDLRDVNATHQMFLDHKPDWVIHLAAKVGGVKANTDFPATFFTDNIRINTNVLDEAYKAGVKKVVSVMSTCIYPAQPKSYPLTEGQLHDGPPHFSNAPYGYAKRMLDVQSRAYREQFGCNFVTVIANNLFGPNDYFGLKNSHVLPALIRKLFEAKERKEKTVTLYGDGSPEREFTFSFDLAKILLFVLEKYSDASPINVGNTQQWTIAQMAELVKRYTGFEGEIIWSGENLGQQKKPSSNKKLLELGWNQYTPMEVALKETVDWFMENYPNVRGMEDK